MCQNKYKMNQPKKLKDIIKFMEKLNELEFETYFETFNDTVRLVIIKTFENDQEK